MALPAAVINGKKTFTVLENNPRVMNALSVKLGLSSDLQWYDVYSLTEPELLALIPRPCLALLVILPLTPTWHANRVAEDKDKAEYEGKGKEEPVVWFKQTIGHACGSIGLLHCLINGPAGSYVERGSLADKLRMEAVPLGMEERAQMLYESWPFEEAHQSVASLGDTIPPSAITADKLGQHFVSFIKSDGKLWELEGSRKGPICRGELGDDEDVLSERGIQLGLGRVIEMEKRSFRGEAGGEDLRFSCIALAKSDEAQGE